MKKYAMFTFDGQAFPLTEQEFEISRKQWLDGFDPIVINGEPINAKNIARIGRHQTTPDIIRMENSNNEQYLRLYNPGKYKALKRFEFKNAKNIIASRNKNLAIENDGRELLEEPISEQEEIKGDPSYWVDEFGIKNYE